MSKFMLIMRDSAEAIEASKQVPIEQIYEAMGRYNESMIAAGVLIQAMGLTDPSEGVVIDYAATPPVATDGPFGEAKELFNGFWIIEVPTIEEAAEWASRAPLGEGSWMEIRGVGGVEARPLESQPLGL